MSLLNVVLAGAGIAATAGLAAWALHRDAITRCQRPPEPERARWSGLPNPHQPPAHRPGQRIADFPHHVRWQIENMIRQGVHYRVIAAAMQDAGWPCSYSALCRYAHRLGIRRRPKVTQPNLENT